MAESFIGTVQDESMEVAGAGGSAGMRRRCMQRTDDLRSDRSTWIEHWRDLNDYIHPRRFRYLGTEKNKGGKKNERIINNTATRALRTLASGSHAGITSPARPWFQLTTPDPDLANYHRVKDWLYTVTERMRMVFARSNIYNALPIVYGELGGFGTSAMFIEDDDEDVIRAYVFPLGQYFLANSSRLQVDSCYREFSMTVGQLVQKFTPFKCSTRVRNLWKAGRYDEWIDVGHAIYPNPNQSGRYDDNESMAYTSCWYERASDDQHGCLGVSGFHEFPVMAPRWAVTGEDVYGYCPAMDALGDVKTLQLLERRKAQALDKLVNPPMRGPSSLRNGRASSLPGDVTYVDTTQGGTTFEPAVVVPAQAIPSTNESIRDCEKRINATFYADLWMMMNLDERQQPSTAREITERHEEKMLQLGPTLERLHDELLDPLIDRTFAIMLRKGLLPPPPQELQGMDLRVEYISIMAQAQKILGTASIERLASFTGSLAGVDPTIMDKVNQDKLVERYAVALGTAPDLVRDQDEVDALRAQRQKAAQISQGIQAGVDLSKGAANLTRSDMSGDNALNRLLGTEGGGQLAPPGTPP